MGRESKVFKDRRCKACGMLMLATAKQLEEHLKLCRIASKLGLILPGAILRPNVKLDIVPG